MVEFADNRVRYADAPDANAPDAIAAGQLLFDFNTEFDEPAPPPADLAARVAELIAIGDTTVLLAGDGPDGLVVLRFRPAIWENALECYLAELYVRPPRRGEGLGRALLTAAIDVAKSKGTSGIDLGTEESDVAARTLYESMGFTNQDKGDTMYFYELNF